MKPVRYHGRQPRNEVCFSVTILQIATYTRVAVATLGECPSSVHILNVVQQRERIVLWSKIDSLGYDHCANNSMHHNIMCKVGMVIW